MSITFWGVYGALSVMMLLFVVIMLIWKGPPGDASPATLVIMCTFLPFFPLHVMVFRPVKVDDKSFHDALLGSLVWPLLIYVGIEVAKALSI